MMYTSIYYSPKSERLILVSSDKDSNKVIVEALRKSTGIYGTGSFDSIDIAKELVYKNYELIGNFKE